MLPASRLVRSRRFLAPALLMLTVFPPLSMDVVMPALPAVAVEMDATMSVVQMTMTAALIGLAVGKLVGGPLSDRIGRRRVLLVGAAAYIVTSLLCAIAPSVGLLIVARVAQGLGAGFAAVAAQAAGRDTNDGPAFVRFVAKMTMAIGIAAAVAPNLGAQLMRWLDWRGLFVTLAGIGALMLAIVAFAAPETHSVENRTTGGLKTTGSNLAALMTDRVFPCALVVAGLQGAAMFAWLGGAAFVLQDMYGLSPQVFGLVVGANAVGMVGTAFFAGRAAIRWGVKAIGVSVAVQSLGAILFVVGGVIPVHLGIVFAAGFLVTSGSALGTPATTSLAISGFPHLAGTATSILGVVRFTAGAIAAPLVGLGGSGTMLPLGIVALSAVGIAAFAVVRVNHLGVAVARTRVVALADRDQAEPAVEKPADGCEVATVNA